MLILCSHVIHNAAAGLVDTVLLKKLVRLRRLAGFRIISS